MNKSLNKRWDTIEMASVGVLLLDIISWTIHIPTTVIKAHRLKLILNIY